MRVKYTKCDFCGRDVYAPFEEFDTVLQGICQTNPCKVYFIKWQDLLTGRKFKMDICQSCMKVLKKYINDQVSGGNQ